MRIILSESQMVQLIKEITRTNPYVDALLDKILDKGLSSLTDKERNDLDKMSRGQDVDYENDEKSQEVFSSSYENHDMFMELFPDHFTVNVDDDEWYISKEIEPGGEFEIISVSCYAKNMSFEINPFAKEDIFEVITTLNTIGFKVTSIPKNSEEMGVFVNKFVKIDLPEIIKKLKNKL